ncbi:MAG: class I SAM-dependent methyltransferase, partial [Elusimicrobia bacterium]|nr:class I SAM-dependent methyltransferase [Elusimicrobiota bacterium]
MATSLRARKLGVGSRWRGLKILDVGAGSGVWSIAALEEDLSSTAVALDFPKILAITREYAAKAGVTDRLTFLEGSMHEARFEAGEYDLVLLGNICHSEGEAATRTFLKGLEPALRPGGKVAVIDMIPNEDRTGPAF